MALFADDNKKFLHGRMEGPITHNEGPVRLVVWELLSIRLWQGGKAVSCPLATEGTPNLVATAVWIITNDYLTSWQQKYKTTIVDKVVHAPRKTYGNISFTEQVYS